ncbi:STAS domain-containing protein [candidate division KSB1 bacterium]|nr:STAS domain-containing protein [candidate division KSB1 bacterium]
MSGFDVVRKDVEAISVVYLKGYLDAHTASDFENALQQLVDEERIQIVVNLSELDYISSAGLGVFMGFIEDIRVKGGDIKLAELSDKVFRVFDLLGFPVLYEIFLNEEEAIQKYQ